MITQHHIISAAGHICITLVTTIVATKEDSTVVWAFIMALNHGLYLLLTPMVLSYALIGAALAPSLRLDRLLLTLLAYFLGSGLAVHTLNELHLRLIQMRNHPRFGRSTIGIYTCRFLLHA